MFNELGCAAFLGIENFEDEIYTEIRGRIKEDDISAPARKGSYYYYTRTLESKEYVQYCRRFINQNPPRPPTVYDVMPTGLNDPPEHVILDENVKAQPHQYYSIGAFKVKFILFYFYFFYIVLVYKCSCFNLNNSSG